MIKVIPTDPGEAAAFARSPDLTVEQLAALAASDLPFLREAAAAHVRSTPALLESLLPTSLAQDLELRVAAAMAGNSNAPAQVLGRFCELLKPAVLDGSHREHHQHRSLALLLVGHLNCPHEAAAALIDRSARSLRLQFAESTSSKELLVRLAQDPSAVVAAAAQARLGEHGA